MSSTVPLRTQRRRSSFERPLSYQMATEEDEDFENYLSVLGTSSPSSSVLGTSSPSISIIPSHSRTRSHPAATTASLEMPKTSHRASMPPSLQLLQVGIHVGEKEGREKEGGRGGREGDKGKGGGRARREGE